MTEFCRRSAPAGVLLGMPPPIDRCRRPDALDRRRTPPRCSKPVRTKGEALGAEVRARVGNMEVQVRAHRAAARIAEPADHLAGLDPISGFHPHAAALQMLVEHESPPPDIQRHVVSARVLLRQRRRGGRRNVRVVRRMSSRLPPTTGIRHGQHLGATSVPVGRLRAGVRRRSPRRAAPGSVDRKAGRDAGSGRPPYRSRCRWPPISSGS